MEIEPLRESILFTVVDDIKFGCEYLKQRGFLKSDYILLVSDELHQVMKNYFEDYFGDIHIICGYGLRGESFEFLKGETYEARFGEGKLVLPESIGTHNNWQNR